MKINLNQMKNLLLPLNYLKCRPVQTMIGEISSLPFARSFFKSRPGYQIFATLNKIARVSVDSLWKIVSGWDLWLTFTPFTSILSNYYSAGYKFSQNKIPLY